MGRRSLVSELPCADHDEVSVEKGLVADRPRVPLSAFDAALMQHLERHLADEETILQQYRDLADSPDETVQYIALLIIDDEQRHHRVLTEMLNQLRSSAWFVEQKPHVPWFTRSTDPLGLKRSVRQLRGFERHDLRQLRRFERRLGFMRRDSLHGVLVRALIMDTRKHLLYLRTLDRFARRK
jgi:hypothetical protein